MRKFRNRFPTAVLTAAVLLAAHIWAVPLQAVSCSEETIQLTARAVAAECGEASYGVQIALAAVIFNRMEDPRFGSTAAQVIWGADFITCTRTGRIALPPEEAVYEKALSAVRRAAEGMDPTDGAVWYGGGETGRNSAVVWYGDGGYLFWGGEK
ncbi:MAG: cell wall hydrolase [Clostridia bacterium]|nr:cell wall hydrolase [Clostridia bacterium]